MVEVTSPGEDPDRKAGFYLDAGVPEWLTVLPAQGRALLRAPGGDGWAEQRTSRLGVTFGWDDGRVAVSPSSPG